MVWEDWKRFTKMINGLRLALNSEIASWNSLKLLDPEKTAICVENGTGKGKFEINIKDYLETLGDESMVIAMAIIYSYALVEAAAGEVAHVGGIEVWADQLLCQHGQTWTKVKGGKAGIVEVAVIRNILAHGSWKFDEDDIRRLQNANYSGKYKPGDKLKLSFSDLEEYTARLRSLQRLLSGKEGRTPADRRRQERGRSPAATEGRGKF